MGVFPFLIPFGKDGLICCSMFERGLSIGFVFGRCDCLTLPQTKKTDVVEHPGVFDHVGVLVNGPPGTTGLPSN